jgi:tetratricopeptide (TPR) repeat protein
LFTKFRQYIAPLWDDVKFYSKEIIIITLILLSGSYCFVRNFHYTDSDIFDFVRKGDKCYTQKEYDEAIKNYRTACFWEPTRVIDEYYYIRMAYCYIGLKKYDKSLSYLKKSERNTNCVDIVNYLYSINYFKQGKYKQSKEHLVIVLKSNNLSDRCRKQCLEILNAINEVERLQNEEIKTMDEIIK